MWTTCKNRPHRDTTMPHTVQAAVRCLFATLFLAFSATLCAQETSHVAVLESNGKIATFCVDISTTKKADPAQTALHALFQTLLEQGVEGVDDGTPLMKKNSPKWKSNFLKADKPPYMSYVKGIYTEGEPLRNQAEAYESTVLVKVNIEFLLRQMTTYGVR